MPQRNPSKRMATRLVLFSLAGWMLWALGRNHPSKDEVGSIASDPWDLHAELDEVTASPKPAPRTGYSRRRLATSLAFATLFFAGAAFSAGAGDVLVEAVEEQPQAASTSTEEAQPAEEPAAEAPAEEPAAEEPAAEEPAPEAPAEEPAAEAPAEEPAPEAPAEEPGAEEPASEAPADQPAAEEPASEAPAAPAPEQPAEQPAAEEPASPADGGGQQVAPTPHEGDLNAGSEPLAARELEIEDEDAFATVWLHRTLPDPTPPAKRLSPAFARRLRTTAAHAGADWALVLGYLRAEGHRGRTPAGADRLERLASRLAALHAERDPWRAVLALKGRTGFADRAVALSRYNRAVGLHALVRGLEASKPGFVSRVLGDSRLDIYPGGRTDVASGKTDVRVLVLLLYLAETHGQVTVSSLRSGHRFFSRPGVPSAHVYGLAVDVAALEGKSITGNQEPNGLTERAVRNILLLPAELRPQQVISLLGLGGPSFPLADHHDHIHIGY
jgi:outer membrane biosynthesis protein TonB